MTTNNDTTAKPERMYSGEIVSDLENGGQVVAIDGGDDQMTFWGAQRLEGAKVGDRVDCFRLVKGNTCAWWITRATQDPK